LGPYGGGGALCDWGGGARFGQRVNGNMSSSGNMCGQGWGTRNQLYSTNPNISQLLWIR